MELSYQENARYTGYVSAGARYQKFGNYILLDRINVGGMAEVFRGKQIGVEGFAKLVALKRILPNVSQDRDFVEMFIDEAKLANQMQHANVVQIYDLGQVDHQYYIAMEYVSGIDLRTIWDRARRRNRLLPIAMSCHIMQRVAEGLDYAHRKRDETGKPLGLVHRDVSPQNILVSFEGEVKVVDFGIAKAKNKISKTSAGILKGKFGYMSPEQVRGIELDNRSDIFACGAVLWELLVGDRLFLGESDFSTLEKVRKADVMRPTELNKNLADTVEGVVMKALTKERDDRYGHASQMAEDLQRYLFDSNQPFARTDLQRYMKQHFKKEIEEEFARTERYRAISLEAVEQPSVHAVPPTESLPKLEIRHHLDDGTMPFDAAPAEKTDPALPADTVPHLPTVLPAWAKALLVASFVVAACAFGLVLHRLPDSHAGTATLTIVVQPADAQILFEGKVVSSDSPHTLTRIRPGQYVVQARKAGFQPAAVPVRLDEDAVHRQRIILMPDAPVAPAGNPALPPTTP